MTPPSTTIVLIHGLWMTPLAWEHWVERYEARGGAPGNALDDWLEAERELSAAP